MTAAKQRLIENTREALKKAGIRALFEFPDQQHYDIFLPEHDIMLKFLSAHERVAAQPSGGQYGVVYLRNSQAAEFLVNVLLHNFVLQLPKEAGLYQLQIARGSIRSVCTAYFNPETLHWLPWQEHTGTNIGYADRITIVKGGPEWTITHCQLVGGIPQ